MGVDQDKRHSYKNSIRDNVVDVVTRKAPRIVSRLVGFSCTFASLLASLLFQIRMGGCKGMLAVWPDSVMESVAGRAGYKVLVRPSMEKFPSNRTSLEV